MGENGDDDAGRSSEELGQRSGKGALYDTLSGRRNASDADSSSDDE